MKRLHRWQIFGTIFTGIMGVLLHFIYEWSGGNVFVAPFSAVNESIWEHLKLIFFPMLIFGLVEEKYLGNTYTNFKTVKSIGVLAGIILIPVLYYTVNGVFGTTPDWINIAIFFVTVIAVYWLETVLLSKTDIQWPDWVNIIIVVIILILFIIFTFVQPQIPFLKTLFREHTEYKTDRKSVGFFVKVALCFGM